MELISDYDLEITYHEGIANIVANALIRKLSHSSTFVIVFEDLSKNFEKINLERSSKKAS